MLMDHTNIIAKISLLSYSQNNTVSIVNVSVTQLSWKVLTVAVICMSGKKANLLNVDLIWRTRSQGFKVHPLSERLPQFASWCRNWTRTVDGSESMFGCGFRGLGVVVWVLELLGRGLRLHLWLHIENTQWSSFPSEGAGSPRAVTLELLDDGRKLGIQRWSASFGPCGQAWSANARVLLLLVWDRRRRTKRNRKGGFGRVTGWCIRISVRRRERCTPFLIAGGWSAGVGAWTRSRCFALGQSTLLHYHWMGTIKQSGPIRHLLLLFMTNKKAAICLFYLVVDNICNALKFARWIYTCKSNII